MAIGEASERCWRFRRVAYYTSLFALSAPIAFYFGPNLILFRKLTWLAPEDFVAEVSSKCVPVVRAMKHYRRDHGQPAENVEALVPDYLPADVPDCFVIKGEFHHVSDFNHMIEYDFSSEREGWYVEGPFVRGRIPFPAVAISSSTQSQPTSTSN